MPASPTNSTPNSPGAPIERSFSPRLNPDTPHAPHFEPPRLPRPTALEDAFTAYAAQLETGEHQALLAQQQLAFALGQSYQEERDRTRQDLLELQAWVGAQRSTLSARETELEAQRTALQTKLDEQVAERARELNLEFDKERGRLEQGLGTVRTERVRLEAERNRLEGEQSRLEAQAVGAASKIGRLYDAQNPARLTEPPTPAQIASGLLVGHKSKAWVWAGIVWSGFLSYGLGLLSAASIFILLGGSLEKVTRALQLGQLERIPYITLSISLIIGLSLTGLVADWIGKLGYHWGLVRRVNYHKLDTGGQDRWRKGWMWGIAIAGLVSIGAIVLLEATLGHEGVLRDLMLSALRQQAMDTGEMGAAVGAVSGFALWTVAVLPMVVLTLSKWVSWASKAEVDVDTQRLRDLAEELRVAHLRDPSTQAALHAHGAAQAGQAPLERARAQLTGIEARLSQLENRLEGYGTECGRILDAERVRLSVPLKPRFERLESELEGVRLRRSDLEREEEHFRSAQSYSLEELHQAASAHGAQVTRRIEAGLPALPALHRPWSLWVWLGTLLSFRGVRNQGQPRGRAA